MKQKGMFILMLFLAIFSVNAHNIWIESNPKAKLQKAHEIKVFFGESYDITPTEKWFSDLKEFKIWVVSPSGKSQELTQKVQNPKHYSLYFTPSEKGVYQIHLKHLVRDVFRKMKITYLSGALVSTDGHSEQTIGEKPLQVQLSSEPLKLKKERKMILMANGEVKKGEKLVVEAPNTWRKTLYSNVRGEVNFTPLWKGIYHLSYHLSQKEEGTHHGQPYEVDYKIVTFTLQTQ